MKKILAVIVSGVLLGGVAYAVSYEEPTFPGHATTEVTTVQPQPEEENATEVPVEEPITKPLPDPGQDPIEPGNPEPTPQPTPEPTTTPAPTTNPEPAPEPQVQPNNATLNMCYSAVQRKSIPCP